jgi:hypothetical protein
MLSTFFHLLDREIHLVGKIYSRNIFRIFAENISLVEVSSNTDKSFLDPKMR